MILLSALLSVAAADPMPSLTFDRSRMRRFECDRVPALEAQRRRPGRVWARTSREADPDVEWVICAERIAPDGLRGPRDEAVLADLRETAAAAAVAAAHRPEWAGATFLVEAYYPSAVVGDKIEFAAKNALVERGVAVSDRSPLLAAGDIDVLTRLPPLQAYPAACQRYRDAGGLREGDVLLALVLLDRDASRLQAAVCESGRWTWLR